MSLSAHCYKIYGEIFIFGSSSWNTGPSSSKYLLVQVNINVFHLLFQEACYCTDDSIFWLLWCLFKKCSSPQTLLLAVTTFSMCMHSPVSRFSLHYSGYKYPDLSPNEQISRRLGEGEEGEFQLDTAYFMYPLKREQQMQFWKPNYLQGGEKKNQNSVDTDDHPDVPFSVHFFFLGCSVSKWHCS